MAHQKHSTAGSRSRWTDRLIPLMVTSSAVFITGLALLFFQLTDGLLHLGLLVFSTFALTVGALHLSRKWSLFASLEARETSLFAVGALVLFLTPLRYSSALTQGPGSSLQFVVWMTLGIAMVASASALLARKAGFFGPWLIGVAAVAVVAWHNGMSPSIHYSPRDMVYLAMSTSFVAVGAVLHIYSLYLRRSVTRAIELRSRGDHKKALRIYDSALRVNPGDEVLWNNKGNVLADLRRYDEAARCYIRALRINPFYHVARLNYDSAAALCRHSRCKKSGNVPGREGGLMSIWKRKVAYQWTWALGAMVSLTYAVELAAGLPATVMFAGTAVEIAVVLDMVTVVLLAFFALNRAGRTLNFMGVVSRNSGDPERALSLFRTAVWLNPFDDSAWTNRGNALATLGHYPEAMACYRRALRLFPGQPAAGRNLGILEKGGANSHRHHNLSAMVRRGRMRYSRAGT